MGHESIRDQVLQEEQGIGMERQRKRESDWVAYYDETDILGEVAEESVDLVLDDTLRREILSGKRKRKLKNLTIKIDPLQIMAIKKLSKMKSIPYQTLIRHWVAEGIKEDLDSVLK
jgi:predicted DNA binding CopG/RHH family protein